MAENIENVTNEKPKVTVRKLVFGDVFALSRIVKKIELNPEFEYKKDAEGNLIPPTKEEYMSRLGNEIVSNLYKAEDEVLALVASLTNKTKEEAFNLGIAQILEVINGLLKDEDIDVFLGQAMK